MTKILQKIKARSASALCEFAEDAVTKNHKMGGCSNRSLLSHSSGGQMSEINVLAGLVPSEILKVNLFHSSLLASGGLLAILLFLGLKIFAFIFIWHPLCVCGYVHIEFFKILFWRQTLQTIQTVEKEKEVFPCPAPKAVAIVNFLCILYRLLSLGMFNLQIDTHMFLTSIFL